MTPTAYPLCWPAEQRRTACGRRRSGYVFARHDASGYRCPPTSAEGVSNVFAELARSGVTDAVISTDIPLRLDGRPRSGIEPGDPGVAVWFRRNGELRCIAVDAFDTPAGNLRAIALAIESIRRLERYGCAEAIQSAAVALLDAPQLPVVEALTGVPESTLRAAIEAGALHALKVGRAWEEVAR